MSMQGRKALEADLQQFMAVHSLQASWHDDGMLLRLAHPDGVNAPAVVSFDLGFWERYDQCDEFTQGCARSNLVTQLVMPYHPQSQAFRAHEARGTLAILASD